MPGSQSVMTTRVGQFRAIYRAVKRSPALRDTTPVVFCEGDSWFSTPLAMNLLDWLVFPSPQDEVRGVPVFGAGGLFLRKEQSGDLATDMFTASRIRRLADWYGGFDFDIALLSAGGNDFVGSFLRRTFVGKARMTPVQAFELVVASGRYAQVLAAYRRVVAAFVAARPNTPIVAHTYDYPVALGEAGALGVAGVGAIALLKHDVGPWIAPHVAHVLPAMGDQRAFARQLIDGLEQRVLRVVRDDPPSRGLFDYVDLRGTLDADAQWFDEMHPTSAGFHRLAAELRAAVLARLPPAKRRRPEDTR
jgi:hypothetical protein